jgi:hypothetical protein
LTNRILKVLSLAERRCKVLFNLFKLRPKPLPISTIQVIAERTAKQKGYEATLLNYDSEQHRWVKLQPHTSSGGPDYDLVEQFRRDIMPALATEIIAPNFSVRTQELRHGSEIIYYLSVETID